MSQKDDVRTTPGNLDTTRRRFVYSGSAFGMLAVAGCLSSNGQEEPANEQTTSTEATSGAFRHPEEEFDAPVVIYWFWGDGCPHCAEQKPFMKQLAGKEDVEVVALEVYNDKENRAIYAEFASAYDIERQGVPLTFIGNEYWLGFSEQIQSEMQDKVASCLESGCPRPTNKL
jgi:thiol-disulfide isomerase/thioredoxin